MSTQPSQHSDEPSHKTTREAADTLASGQDFDTIDLRDLFKRLGRGLGQIIGLAMLGTVIALVSCLTTSPRRMALTVTRVIFSFDGFEKGEYPDGSKFQPDDLRAPEIISKALKRQGLDATGELQSQIRGALNIEGIVPPDITKDRDRLRTLGQTPQPYTPDEYVLTLSLPRDSSLDLDQRAHLLSEIVSVYRENFQRTYASVPIDFGNVFDVLPHADFPEYEQILNREIDKISAYLAQQLDQGKSFRSPTTNLSFQDLLGQTQLFAQTQLDEVLGLIYQGGLARNHATAMAKMDYSLRVLDDEERHAIENEKVVRDLLAQTETQTQNYVLGIKSQANPPRAESSTLDQGLINSLLANDAYNFLVRRALDAGLQVKQVQAEKAQLLERLEAVKSAQDDAGAIAQVEKSLGELKPAYDNLIANIRTTQADFSRQQFADAIRLSDVVTTVSGISRAVLTAGVVGCFLGLAAGLGLSLLGIYIGSAKRG
jgi:hypothetical protein